MLKRWWFICAVIVVHDADRISSDLQHYIGWFLGRYAGCNKIVFCCSSSSNLEAVEHLCKVISLKPPSFDEVHSNFLMNDLSYESSAGQFYENTFSIR
jgi:hypothetical protein